MKRVLLFAAAVALSSCKSARSEKPHDVVSAPAATAPRSGAAPSAKTGSATPERPTGAAGPRKARPIPLQDPPGLAAEICRWLEGAQYEQHVAALGVQCVPSPLFDRVDGGRPSTNDPRDTFALALHAGGTKASHGRASLASCKGKKRPDHGGMGACIGTPGGAWFSVMTGVHMKAPVPGARFGNLWACPMIAHIDRNGEAALLPWHETSDGQCEEIAADFPFEKVVADYDGDGEPEYFFSWSTGGYSAIRNGFLYTYRNGKVALYPHKPIDDQRTIVELGEIDHDGVEDPLLSESACPYDDKGIIRTGSCPVFAAHALPDGSFDTGDADAKNFFRQTCPERPKSICSRADVGCALAWGQGRDILLKRVGRDCDPAADPESRDVRSLARYAETTRVPLRLE